MESSIPKTMTAWRFHRTAHKTRNSNPFDNSLTLQNHYPLPSKFLKLPPDSALIRVLYSGLNPVDTLFATAAFIAPLMHPSPMTPGHDFAGRVVATTASTLRVGQLVAGRLAERSANGSMAEFVVAGPGHAVAISDGVEPAEAAAAATCGITAVQALLSHAGARVVIRGASGGAGVFMVQVAKALGCYVAAVCSGGNAELCTTLGADEVLDYRSLDIGQTLGDRVDAGESEAFDLVVDCVGGSFELYKAADRFLKPSGRYIQIAATFTWSDISNALWIQLLPRILGGGRRKWGFLAMKYSKKDFELVLKWMAEKKVRVPVDEIVPFSEVPRAYNKLCSKRTKGKIVVKLEEDY